MRRVKGQPNVVVYSALIKAYERASQWERAVRILSLMLDGSQPRPNRVTWGAVISSASQGHAWQHALLLLSMARRHELQLITSINIAISACAASKHWRHSLALLDECLAPDLVTFNAFLAACESAQKWESALQTIQTMQQRHFQPDLISFNTWLSTYQKDTPALEKRAARLFSLSQMASEWERALDVFKEMSHRGALPDDISYNVVISACHQAAQWQVATGLLCAAASGFDPLSCASGLLEALQKAMMLLSGWVAGQMVRGQEPFVLINALAGLLRARSCWPSSADLAFLRRVSAPMVASLMTLCVGGNTMPSPSLAGLATGFFADLDAMTRRTIFGLLLVSILSHERTFTLTGPDLQRCFTSAYHAVRRSHPDAPGGSAKKLQKVKDAYDYLISAPEVKVWDEGRRQYGASGSSSSGFPPPPPSTKPWPDPARRELIIGGIAGATLVSILIATQVVNTERRDEYLNSFEAEVAWANNCRVLLLGDVLPGGDRTLGMATRERTMALTKCLAAVLSAYSGDQPAFKSVTAVISQGDLNLVADQLRQQEDEGLDIREPSKQELLLLPSQRLYVASSDFDPLGPKTLAELHKPKLVVFDLSKQQWEELKVQYETNIGAEVRAKLVENEQLMAALQEAVYGLKYGTERCDSVVSLHQIVILEAQLASEIWVIPLEQEPSAYALTTWLSFDLELAHSSGPRLALSGELVRPKVATTSGAEKDGFKALGLQIL
eukprot:g24870.t1